MQKLAIIGCGAWGSALGIALADNFAQIAILCHNDHQAQEFTTLGHPVLGVQYPKNVKLVSDYTTLKNTDGILIATPSSAFSEILGNIKSLNSKHIAWATKGFSENKLLSEVFKQKLDIAPCAISGPSFAIEVAQKKPTALVVASTDTAQLDFWSQAVNTQNLRAYTTTDIIGVQIGGAVKNILAIAAGIAAGLGFGANTISALITRGLAEMSRFGTSLGADAKTFMGLSGLGDLTLTCFDDNSRNRQFGTILATNNNIESAITKVGATVEGIKALDVVLDIANKQNIEMPICEQVKNITSGKISAKNAITNLMSRGITSE
jgi:glycerol-3-phosphate dehydrogenase (NAD(P)+)